MDKKEEQFTIKINEKAFKQAEEITAVEELAGSDVSNDDLKDQSDSDLDAAEALMIRLVGVGEAAAAEQYILRTLADLRVTAANFVEGLSEQGMDFGRDIETFAMAVSEQFYDDKCSKKLLKLYSSSDSATQKLIDDADGQILKTAVMKSLTTAISCGHYDTLKFTLDRAPKHAPVRDYKKTFILSVSLFNGSSEAAYEDVNVYAFNPRNKKSQEGEVVLGISSKLRNLAENAAKLVKAGEVIINLLGNENKCSFGNTENNNVQQKQAFHTKTGNIKDSQINVSVNTSEDKVLISSICSQCGKQVGDTDTCPYCGSVIEKSSKAVSAYSNGDIILNITQQASDAALTALVCSQCGSPVYVHGDDGERALCSSCGSCFILNKKALGIISSGLDFKHMEQEKPKGEMIPQLNFIVKSLFDGKLGVIMPDEFQLMDAKTKAIKYNRGRPPELVFTNEAGTTNFTFTVQYGQRTDGNNILETNRQVMLSLKQVIPSAYFGKLSSVKIGRKCVAFFDCITPAADCEIYNYMLHFSLAGNIVLGSFNCLAKDRWFWSEIFKVSAQSLQFDD